MIHARFLLKTGFVSRFTSTCRPSLNGTRDRDSWHFDVSLLLACALGLMAFLPSANGQDDAAVEDANAGAVLVDDAFEPASEPFLEQQSDWGYFAPLTLPPISAAANEPGPVPPLVDLILGPEVFSQARLDLADLRLYNSANEVLPYALRTLAPKSIREAIAAAEFNRTGPETGPQELMLELQPESVEHNEIQIDLTGEEFRRVVEVDGREDDKQQWQRMVSANLIRFTDGDQKIDTRSLVYEVSRLRFIRVRVQPDPNPSYATTEGDQFEISKVSVLRTVNVPGERIVWNGIVSKREPTRVYGSPGSAWTIDLQGNNVPCDQIDVEVEGSEFVRDIEIQIEQPSGPLGQMAFLSIYDAKNTSWQRKLGEPKRMMTVSFPEVQASRLRLLVADYRNAPLTIRAIKLSASARQIVFARPTPPETDLSLYFGNPSADLPKYDFAGNLPENPSVLVRAGLKETFQNPDFVPPPQPFTERFPWLIYFVLGSVAMCLLVVITNLAKTAIVIHDAH